MKEMAKSDIKAGKRGKWDPPKISWSGESVRSWRHEDYHKDKGTLSARLQWQEE